MKKFLLFVFIVVGVLLFDKTNVFAKIFKDPACAIASNYCQCNFNDNFLSPGELITVTACSPEWIFASVPSDGESAGHSYVAKFNSQEKKCDIDALSMGIDIISGEQCSIGSYAKAEACDCAVSYGDLGVISKDMEVGTLPNLSAGSFMWFNAHEISVTIQNYLRNTNFCPLNVNDIKPFLNKSAANPEFVSTDLNLISRIDDWNLVCNPITKPQNVCCCVTTFDGTNNKKQFCEKKTVLPTNDAKCGPVVVSETFSAQNNGGVSNPNLANLPTPTLFELPASGDCTELENINKNYQGTATNVDLSIDQLKTNAKTVLNPFNFGTGRAGVLSLIGKVIKFWTFAIGSLLLLSYVWAGFLWITSAGSSEKIGAAKKIFVWSTLGVVVTLASYMILNMVFQFLG